VATLRNWLETRTAEVPEVLKALDDAYAELLGKPFDPKDHAEYAWDTKWRDHDSAPRWLRQTLAQRRDVGSELLRSEGIAPAAGDALITDLSRNFRSSAAWVFVIHGNVRDYMFDAHHGFAGLGEVLQSYWVNTSRFAFDGEIRERVMLRYTLSGGIELLGDPASAAARELNKRIGDDSTRARMTREERVFHDFSTLRDLLQRADSPPMLLYFERPALLFPATADQFRIGNWVESILRWASSIPPVPHHMIVLAADALEDLHPELRKRVNGIVQLEIQRPARATDRRRFLLAAAAASGPDAGECRMPHTRFDYRFEPMPFTAASSSVFADATAGLNYTGIETCLLNILENAVVRESDALQYIREQRGELLRTESEGLIQVIEPSRGLDAVLGGLEHVRKRLHLIVDALSSPDPVKRALAPMGVLFVGPPGTGKSLAAGALAFEASKAGIQYVRLGDFREMWVGQSERNFSRILQLLQSFGRVIVFMDELDQGEGASRNVEAHETSRRVFGKLLEFMASPRNRGQILWIAASNRPAKIDTALLRPGRFDLILPFDLPDAAGCREILERHLAATSMKIALSAEGLAKAASLMSAGRLAGAEIELIAMETARRVAVAIENSRITDDNLLAVIADYDPESKKTPEWVEMVEECRGFSPFKSLRGEA